MTTTIYTILEEFREAASSKRVVCASFETVRIVKGLPPLEAHVALAKFEDDVYGTIA